MRICLSMLFLAAFSSIAHAVTYKWSDENSMHFTENIDSVPPF
jgi:hypothetical protein